MTNLKMGCSLTPQSNMHGPLNSFKSGFTIRERIWRGIAPPRNVWGDERDEKEFVEKMRYEEEDEVAAPILHAQLSAVSFLKNENEEERRRRSGAVEKSSLVHSE